MRQSRLQSFSETLVTVFSGFLLAWAVWIWVMPWLGFHASYAESFGITVLFTVVSIIRSYVVRRAFNWLHHLER